MDRLSFLTFQKGVTIALILVGHCLQFYVYINSEDYWQDPIYKSCYIFAFAYYLAINGYMAAEKLSQTKLRDVVRFKFQQYLLPMCFWLGLTLALTPVFNAYGATHVTLLKTVSSTMNGYWLLWSDVVAVILIRLLHYLPVKPAIALPLSIVAFLAIPDDLKYNLFSLVRYGYIAVCIGYLFKYYNIKVINSWWIALLVAPLCIFVYVNWSANTYIYINRLNVRVVSNYKDIALMIMGTAAFIFVCHPILRYIYLAFGRTSHVVTAISTIGKLYAQVILFENFIFGIVNRVLPPRTGIFGLDFGLSICVTFALMSLIPLSFYVIKPDSVLFRLIWGVKPATELGTEVAIQAGRTDEPGAPEIADPTHVRAARRSQSS